MLLVHKLDRQKTNRYVLLCVISLHTRELNTILLCRPYQVLSTVVSCFACKKWIFWTFVSYLAVLLLRNSFCFHNFFSFFFVFFHFFPFRHNTGFFFVPLLTLFQYRSTSCLAHSWTTTPGNMQVSRDSVLQGQTSYINYEQTLGPIGFKLGMHLSREVLFRKNWHDLIVTSSPDLLWFI